MHASTAIYFAEKFPSRGRIQGAYGKFLQNLLDIYEAYNEAIKMCNTAMEREFCQLLEYV